jgi:hypothetical protein
VERWRSISALEAYVLGRLPIVIYMLASVRTLRSLLACALGGTFDLLPNTGIRESPGTAFPVYSAR